MIPAVALVAGVLLGLFLEPTVPLALQPYLPIAVVAALAVALALCWRDRAVLSIARVALWVEEHFPSLEYALVTGVETGDESFITGVDPDRWTASASRRAVALLGGEDMERREVTGTEERHMRHASDAVRFGLRRDAPQRRDAADLDDAGVVGEEADE